MMLFREISDLMWVRYAWRNAIISPGIAGAGQTGATTLVSGGVA